MSDDNSFDPLIHNIKYKLKGLMLFIVPFPVLISAIIDLFSGQITSAIINAGAFAGFMFAANIARLGFKIEGEGHQYSIVKATNKPYKTMAALLLSITTALTAWLSVHYSIFTSGLIGISTFIGFALYFGLDPRKDKSIYVDVDINVDEIIKALEDAELSINAIESARQKITNINFNSQLKRITDKARSIIKIIEANPNELDRSRKFLKVYLTGAKKVTEGYANAGEIKQGNTLNVNFADVLDSIEKTFDKQQDELKKNNHFDLDIQIEVLKTQLKQG